jgi:hypothetical protein
VNRDRRFVVADSYLKQFTIVEPARTYPRIVAALSSVVPLCGCGDPTALARKGLWLVKRWRSRIRTLDMAGWELTRNHPAIRSRNGKAAEAKQAVSAKWRMINCRPSAFAARPKTPVCGQRQICPHCWGRKAATTWHTIDAVLFGTRPAPVRQQRRPRLFTAAPAKATPVRAARLVGTAFIIRKATYPLPFRGTTGGPLLPDALTRRLSYGRTPMSVDGLALIVPSRYTEQRKLVKYGVTGGLEVITLSLGPQSEGRYYNWVFHVRQLLVVPRDKVATVLADRKLFPSAPGQAADWDPLQGWADPPDRFPVVRARLIDEPTRRQLASSVGIVYRYPAFYMEAPSRHVLTVLGVTRGRRMMATFGVCRARKAGKILPG